MHITRIKSLIMVLAVGLVSFASHAAQNIAYQDADTRFTVVADGVVRMEWHRKGAFSTPLRCSHRSATTRPQTTAWTTGGGK